VLPPDVSSRIQRINDLLALVEPLVASADFKIQNVYSSHLALLAAGLVENGVKDILSHYAGQHGDNRLKLYVGSAVSYENALNCEKVKKILERFDSQWWTDFSASLTLEEKEAVDSLKNLRDQIAHGNHNGTGFQTVRSYYLAARTFVTKLGNLVTPAL